MLTLNYLIYNQEQPLIELYSPIELGHLRDVKQLTDLNLFLFGISLIILLIFRKSPLVRRSLIYGGLAAVCFVAAVFIAVQTAWEFFFIGFHRLFFPQGNWAFPADATLIQLFPEIFWFDAFRNLSILILILALIAVFLGFRFSHRRRR